MNAGTVFRGPVGLPSAREVIEVPSLEALGIDECNHQDASPLHDGSRICLHCRAIKDGDEWRGGSLRARRFWLPVARSFIQGYDQQLVPTATMNVDDWNAGFERATNVQKAGG